MVCTAQDVPREYQLMFGCTRLQELEYFCMLQSTQQFVCVNYYTAEKAAQEAEGQQRQEGQ
jgi:hypothetical protein